MVRVGRKVYNKNMDITKIKINPSNPRIIKDDKFEKLCQSIKDFPKMLELRPIIVDSDGIILGGNMRFKAIQELGLELKQEWFMEANNLTDVEKRRFIIEDNIGFGEWDWEKLNEEFGKEELEEWGLDVDKSWDNEYEGKNSEIDTESLGKDLNIECPKCHFKFKN